MGSVFLAERADGTIEQQVAIKIVRPELLDEHTIARFRLERQVLALLNHPNIAKLLDAGELDDGSPYVVMEYVEGTPITQFVARENLNLRQRLDLFLKVCEAVAFAHRNLIVHRDLKPGNVLVTDDGQPKLLDFGIAKPLVGTVGAIDVNDTADANRFFSPHNAAPEQLRNELITPACDVYGLGALLYEMLTGRRPLELQGLTPIEIEHTVLSEDPKAPSTRLTSGDSAKAGRGRNHSDAGFPAASVESSVSGTSDSADSSARTWDVIAKRALEGDLDAIVLKCLRKGASDRYTSVEQLAADIHAHLQGHVVAARRGGRWYQLRRFVGRNRLAVGAATTLVVLATVGTVVWFQQYLATIEQQSRADQMTSLIMDAIEAADPGTGSAEDFKVRDLFDQIVKDASAKAVASGHWDVQLFTSLSGVEQRLGSAESALKLVESFDVLSLPNSDRIDVLRARVRALLSLHRLEESRVLVHQAIVLPQSLESLTGWKLIETLIDFNEGKVQAALDKLQLIELVELPFKLQAEVRLQIARCMVAMGMNEAALKQLQLVLDDQALLLPNDDPSFLETYEIFGSLFANTNELDLALEFAEKYLRLSEQLYSRDSYRYGWAKAKFATVLSRMGKQEESIAVFLEVLETYRKALGENHPNVAKLHFNISGAYHELGNSEQVLVHLDSAVQIAEKAWLPSDSNLLLFRAIYASQLIEANRFQDAQQMARRAIADVDKNLSTLADNSFRHIAILIDAFAEFLQEPTSGNQALATNT